MNWIFWQIPRKINILNNSKPVILTCTSLHRNKHSGPWDYSPFSTSDKLKYSASFCHQDVPNWVGSEANCEHHLGSVFEDSEFVECALVVSVVCCSLCRLFSLKSFKWPCPYWCSPSCILILFVFVSTFQIVLLLGTRWCSVYKLIMYVYLLLCRCLISTKWLYTGKY